MIPGVNLVDFIISASILGVALIIFAESGLLVGFFLPGDSLLFTAGFLINSGVLDVNIALAIAIFFVAAVAGDSVGYWFGNKAGPRIFAKEDARLFKKEYIERAQQFYEKYGGISIVLARFIPVVRTFAPIVAGAGDMPYKKFLSFNIIGGALWTVGVTLLGFFLGKWFEMMGLDIDQVLLPLVIIIIIISVLPPALHIFLNKKRRESFVHGLKREAKALFRKRKP